MLDLWAHVTIDTEVLLWASHLIGNCLRFIDALNGKWKCSQLAITFLTLWRCRLRQKGDFSLLFLSRAWDQFQGLVQVYDQNYLDYDLSFLAFQLNSMQHIEKWLLCEEKFKLFSTYFSNFKNLFKVVHHKHFIAFTLTFDGYEITANNKNELRKISFFFFHCHSKKKQKRKKILHNRRPFFITFYLIFLARLLPPHISYVFFFHLFLLLFFFAYK